MENYSKFFINIIKDEIKNDLLNEKGIYFLLKIISNIINYICKFYINNKLRVNKYAFISLEFIEFILRNYLNNNYFWHKDILCFLHSKCLKNYQDLSMTLNFYIL